MIITTENQRNTQSANTSTTPIVATKEPIEELLVNLGKHLLANTDHTDWLDMDSVLQGCKTHGVTLANCQPTPKELEIKLRCYFSSKEEMYREGINVIWNDWRVGWELVFMVRFYYYDPKQLGYSSAHLINAAEEAAKPIETATYKTIQPTS